MSSEHEFRGRGSINLSIEVRTNYGRGGRTVGYVCTTNERLCPTKAARAAPTADLNVGAFRTPRRMRSFPSTQVLRNRPRRIRVRWVLTRDGPLARAARSQPKLLEITLVSDDDACDASSVCASHRRGTRLVVARSGRASLECYPPRASLDYVPLAHELPAGIRKGEILRTC